MANLRVWQIFGKWNDLDRNFKVILLESLILGVYFSYDPFISVFLARLGATNLQVSLLTSLPAILGLLISIPVGGFLQTRAKIVPWYSIPRAVLATAVVLTGLVPFLFQGEKSVIPILVVWGLAALPNNILMITFTVVMNAVAGPEGRFRLMSSRWGIVCTASAVAMIGVGWFLDRVSFPLNYQVIFIVMALFGFAGSYVSHQIKLVPQTISESHENSNLKKRYTDLFSQVLKSQPFLSFTSKRFVFALGTMITYPLFPLYYVREVHASDLWIGVINTAQMAVIVVGYFFWMRLSKKRRDPYFILLITAFATALYPVMVASTLRVELIVIIVGVIAFFQAGADLSFFDEQLRNTPQENPVTFIAASQSITYLATIIGPILGSFLADQFSLSTAMIVGGGMKMVSFILFLLFRKNRLQLEASIH